jgi:hypothetical protein
MCVHLDKTIFSLNGRGYERFAAIRKYNTLNGSHRVNFVAPLKLFELVVCALFPSILLKVMDLTVNNIFAKLLQGLGGHLFGVGRDFLLPLNVLETGHLFAPSLTQTTQALLTVEQRVPCASVPVIIA